MSAEDLDSMMGIAEVEAQDEDSFLRAQRELARLRTVDTEARASREAERWGTASQASQPCENCGHGGRGHDFEPDLDAFATLLGAGDDESIYEAARRRMAELQGESK